MHMWFLDGFFHLVKGHGYEQVGYPDGEVLNTGGDVLLYEGMSLKELEDDFRKTVDLYMNREA